MKDDLVLLQHIRDSILKIEEYVAGGEAEFLSTSLIQDAVIRNFEIIGEATKGLSDQTKLAYPEIPWRNVSGMRDFLIHVYFGVKLELIWQTIQTNLPPLKTAVLTEIQKRGNP